MTHPLWTVYVLGAAMGGLTFVFAATRPVADVTILERRVGEAKKSLAELENETSVLQTLAGDIDTLMGWRATVRNRLAGLPAGALDRQLAQLYKMEKETSVLTSVTVRQQKAASLRRNASQRVVPKK